MKTEPVTPTCRFCKHWDGVHCVPAVEDHWPMFAVTRDLEAVQVVTLPDFGCVKWEGK